MDTRQFEYILAIAEKGSLSRAAERLHVSQPTLSQFLSRLEKELGAPLFRHTRGAFLPTPEGEVYLEGARLIVRTIAETQERITAMAERNSKRLVVGMSHGRSARLISEFLPAFSQLHPDIRLEIVEAPTPNIDELVRSGYLDLGLVTGDEEDERLAFEPFTEEEILFVESRRHRLARQAGASERSVLGGAELSGLKGERFIMAKKGYRLRGLVDRRLEEAGVEPFVSLESTDNELTCNMVAEGLGVAFVPEAYARRHPELVARPLEPRLVWHFGAEYRRDHATPPHMRHFLDLIRERDRRQDELERGARSANLTPSSPS